MLYKFDAMLVEVELDPAEAGSFTVLDTDENGYSMQSFKPASELTYNILPKSKAGEHVQVHIIPHVAPSAQSLSPLKAASKA